MTATTKTKAAKVSAKATKATKTAAKTTPVVVAKPEGWLPKAQIRILRALAKAKRPMNRQELSDAADVPLTHVMGFAGDVHYATKPFPALGTIGLVKLAEVTPSEEEGGRVIRTFEITAKGRQALARAEKLATNGK